MTDEIEGVKVALIGGQDAWANRMKKLFPEWVFITAGESLGLDRALGGVDIAFFLTDSISHAMYYKMLGTVRSKEQPGHKSHLAEGKDHRKDSKKSARHQKLAL